MKFIKKFESFLTDDNRGDEQAYPKYNQANNLRAKDYVDSVFNSGSGPEVTKICKEIGCERPSDDSSLEKVREKAVEYFKQNPERIPDIGSGGFKTYPFNGGDAVVRTNNIGGTQIESSRPGPTDLGSTKVVVSKDEMRLFGKEASLIGLIKRNKIALHNGEVWFKKDDEIKCFSPLAVEKMKEFIAEELTA